MKQEPFPEVFMEELPISASPPRRLLDSAMPRGLANPVDALADINMRTETAESIEITLERDLLGSVSEETALNVAHVKARLEGWIPVGYSRVGRDHSRGAWVVNLWCFRNQRSARISPGYTSSATTSNFFTYPYKP